MSRLCDAHKCGASVPAGRFLCSKHWRLVPLSTQKTINHQYRAGRKDFAFLSDPIYLQACIDAITHLAQLESNNIDLNAGKVASYSRLLRVALKRRQEGGAA